MKNKKTIWICVLALLLVAVVVLACTQFGGRTPKTDAPNADTLVEKTPDDAINTVPEDAAEEEENTESAQMLEDQGDLIIIIPDDQEADGF